MGLLVVTPKVHFTRVHLKVVSGRFVHRHPVSVSISLGWAASVCNENLPAGHFGVLNATRTFQFSLGFKAGVSSTLWWQGCLFKIAWPLLLHIQVTSPPMGTSKLNPACAFIFYRTLRRPTSSFLFSSSHLPSFSSASCVQWGAKLFKGGKIDFYLQFWTARPVFCIAEDF